MTKHKRALITCDRLDTQGDWAAGFLDIRMGSKVPGEVVIKEMLSSPPEHGGSSVDFSGVCGESSGDRVGTSGASCC